MASRFVLTIGSAVAMLSAQLTVTPALAVPAQAPDTQDAVAAVEQLLDPPNGATSVGAHRQRQRLEIKVSNKKTQLRHTVAVGVKRVPVKRVGVTFQMRKPGAEWQVLGRARTKKRAGTAVRTFVPNRVGTYRVRATAKNPALHSAVRTVVVKKAPSPRPVPPRPTPTPTPEPTPPTPAIATGISAVWPTGTLAIDRDYPVVVTVQPAGEYRTKIQQFTAGSWQDVPGGDGVSNAQGSVTLDLNQSTPGSGRFRVMATDTPAVVTEAFDAEFTDAADAFFNVPRSLPGEPGQLVKAQEFPLTWPKLSLPNPLADPPGSSNLVVPQVGSPAAGADACVMDDTPRQDCKIPGRQYRIMYTDQRWVPNANGDGGGAVANGTEAATALLFVPENVKPGAKVVAWGHPTIGQANACSVTRGTDDLPVKMPDGSNAPGGVDSNLLDVAFFMTQMLQAGNIVVMPDYLGIAVNGPTSNTKTYLVGPQAARDLFYAVKSLQTPAGSAVDWPGIPTPSNDFVAVGHSQGGHAAMWAGIESKSLGQQTGLKLKGVVALAPASDLNMIVNQTAQTAIGWQIGPEVIQTWGTYLGKFALENNVLTDKGMQQLPDLASKCLAEAKATGDQLIEQGYSFLQDPQDPKYAGAYYNLAQVFAQQSPIADNDAPNGFPLDLPLLLISGNNDTIVLSQANAAMQQQFCSAGAQLQVFWTGTLTGAINPPSATEPSDLQTGTHSNIGFYPMTNVVGVDKSKNIILRTAAGSILNFTSDRFADKAIDRNCNQMQQVHSDGTPFNAVDTWYIFPRLSGTKIDPSKTHFYESPGQPLLMPPSVLGNGTKNPAPALGSLDGASSGKQTGCGFIYMPNGFFKVKSNTACTQWGLAPWGKFIYSDHDEDEQSWGTYPFHPAQVTARGGKNRLSIKVLSPHKGKKFRVKVQRRAQGQWQTVRITRVSRGKDTVKVKVSSDGRHRLVLPAQKGHQKLVSKVVRVR